VYAGVVCDLCRVNGLHAALAGCMQGWAAVAAGEGDGAALQVGIGKRR
jgi:hypothetical protein